MALVRVLEEVELGAVHPPWETDPRGVVSLLDMLRLYADLFMKTAFQLTLWEGKFSEAPADHLFTEHNQAVVGAKAGLLWLHSTEHQLKGSVGKCARVQNRCQNRPLLTYGEMVSMLTGIRESFEDDLAGELFLHLTLAEARLYDSPTEEWQEARSKFHKTTFDIEEAAKCLALGRYTAAVFHLQRVMEFGLKTLAAKLGKPFDRNSWDAHLKDIEKELEARYKAAGTRTPDEEFYSEAAAQIGHVKVAWRNPTMHIDRTYIEEIARDIWNAVKAFMRHLSTKLP